MTLHVEYVQTFLFTCRSTSPIKMSKDYPYDNQICTSVSSLRHYTQQADLSTTVPDKNPEIDWLKVEGKDWQTLELKITCDHFGEVMRRWTYTLVNSFTKYLEQIYQYILTRVEFAGSYDIDVENNKMIVDLFNGVYFCVSPAPSTLRVRFVPCSTFNDCQMKSQLLYRDTTEV